MTDVSVPSGVTVRRSCTKTTPLTQGYVRLFYTDNDPPDSGAEGVLARTTMVRSRLPTSGRLQGRIRRPQ